MWPQAMQYKRARWMQLIGHRLEAHALSQIKNHDGPLPRHRLRFLSFLTF